MKTKITVETNDLIAEFEVSKTFGYDVIDFIRNNRKKPQEDKQK